MSKKNRGLLAGLGYEPDAKLFMIHADDAGLSHSENSATIRAMHKGIVNSYSIMVPCPWFYEIADFAKQYPEYDYGIHLTLTCEWNSYRFGPVLGQKEVPGLNDRLGYFHKKRKDVLDNAKPEEIKKELCAQIERALTFGLTPTHLDSHMYTLGASMEFLELYREVGKIYQLPVMLNKKLISEMSGIPSSKQPCFDEIVVDHFFLGNFTDFNKGKLENYYANALRSLKPGFNLLLIHPAYDDAEMKAVTINHPNFGSAWRHIDLEFFTSDRCNELLKEQQAHMVSWKDIKKVMYPE